VVQVLSEEKTAGRAVAVATKTASYTATAADEVILVSAASGAVTITLPAASGAAGRRYTIKKTDVGLNTVTIDGNGSETIDGALTLVIANQYEAYTIVCNGSGWFVV
jgi:flagellar hook assembly protein FlgD